ncbi:MAG: 1-acyl-sn-glycerol-3-phosphate acyltransferase [Spirosomaceae bacterium]|nr:1-acyl-sn-glycerol-3-phosphate acyltransferase [Spirosomataceae bacterium]
MNYRILHTYCLLIVRFFIKAIHVTGTENVPKKGSVIFAGTHPNSFIDGMIVNLTFHRPIWSLARGDAFGNKWAKKFMHSIKLMPIYRLSEGREHLSKNDSTFNSIQELLERGEGLCIFSEGICTNQTKLLPLKKGTARMVQSAWEADIDTVVFPVGLTYSNFDKIVKTVNLNFGEAIVRKDFENVPQNTFLVNFNRTLKSRLEEQLSWVFKPGTFFDNPLYYIGWVINFPWYFLCRFTVNKLTKGTVFTDSVYFASLILTLPIYWGILIVLYNVIF